MNYFIIFCILVSSLAVQVADGQISSVDQLRGLTAAQLDDVYKNGTLYEGGLIPLGPSTGEVLLSVLPAGNDRYRGMFNEIWRGQFVQRTRCNNTIVHVSFNVMQPRRLVSIRLGGATQYIGLPSRVSVGVLPSEENRLDTLPSYILDFSDFSEMCSEAGTSILPFGEGRLSVLDFSNALGGSNGLIDESRLVGKDGEGNLIFLSRVFTRLGEPNIVRLLQYESNIFAPSSAATV